MTASESCVGQRLFLEMFWSLSSCLKQNHFSTLSYTMSLVCKNQCIQLVVFLLENKHKDSGKAQPWWGRQAQYSSGQRPVSCRDCPLHSQHCVWVGYFISHAQTLSHARLFATPWTVAHRAPLSTGFPRQEYWSGLPVSPPGDLPNPGIEPRSPVSPPLQAVSLLLSRRGGLYFILFYLKK